MTPKQIDKAIAEGKTVTLRIRHALRGYTHGYQSITFKPGDKNTAHRLKCFRCVAVARTLRRETLR